MMLAAIIDRYGGPELVLKEVPTPEPASAEVLVPNSSRTPSSAPSW
jgi:NADPH:quinone reductase-like Zn-dependent oxidoreductase